ncbi:MAG: outer membrane beta-barrel protein [Candidatus Aminicenantes bacterium]|nr:outer membrane beta-barrel protein [Candidatus Aminicenantes bacterium]
MKILQKMLMVVLMLIIPVSTILAQADKGDKEFSTAASFMVIKPEGGELFSGFHLAGRFGYFLSKNIEIEPEVAIGKFEDADVGYVLSCNLNYNLTAGGKTVPFFLAGGGVCNTAWFVVPNLAIAGGEDTYMLLNAGLGVKVFLSETAAFRAEYRFQHIFAEYGYITYHYGLIGFSFFLKK